MCAIVKLEIQPADNGRWKAGFMLAKDWMEVELLGLWDDKRERHNDERREEGSCWIGHDNMPAGHGAKAASFYGFREGLQ